jgi:tripartite-type tricarboxylate transporter receptor subunit TctC
LFGTNAFIITPLLHNGPTYDPIKDFSHVSLTTIQPLALLVSPSLNIKSVEQLVQYAKANPGKINFASSGIGSSSHLAGELFKSMAKLDIVHIPYKGSGAAVSEVLGGGVQMSIDSLSVYQSHIKAGRIKALAVSTQDRTPAIPELPTIGDTLKGYQAFPVNYITAPAGTPRAIIDRLNKDFNAVLQDPVVRERLMANGLTVKGGTPEQMDAVIKSESAKWKRVIEQANIGKQ